MCMETSRACPKRNHEGTHKEDSILQEISSAPPIIESNPMDDNSNRRLLGEDLPGTQMSFRECFVGRSSCHKLIGHWTATL